MLSFFIKIKNIFYNFHFIKLFFILCKIIQIKISSMFLHPIMILRF